MPTSKASSISACDERTRPLTRAKNQMGKCICESKAFRRAGFGEVIPPGGPIIYSALCRSVSIPIDQQLHRVERDFHVVDTIRKQAQ
jgi:hypothetical protein